MGLAVLVPQPTLPIIPQDQQTLEGVLAQYSPTMYRAALRKLGNPADAEDAVQDALLSASKNIAQFKGECHISTWLVAIAINAARMQLRRQLRHRVVSLERTPDDGTAALVYEPADGRPDPEEIYRRVEMRGIISQLTTQLSPPLRNAFRLRVLEGLSTRDAARTLGVTVGTLKAQLFRARERISWLMRKTLGLPGAGRCPKRQRRARNVCRA